MKTLEDLFIAELADMYDAESRLAKALPKLAKAATHKELREAIESHLEETEQQTKKLQRVFKAFGQAPHGKKCDAIVGLLKEAEKIVSENQGSPTINAALICAAQKLEHYEIASYGCLREWAEQLGNQTAADLLQEILDEEKTADEELTELARERCNDLAQRDEIAPRSVRPMRARTHVDTW